MFGPSSYLEINVAPRLEKSRRHSAVYLLGLALENRGVHIVTRHRSLRPLLQARTTMPSNAAPLSWTHMPWSEMTESVLVKIEGAFEIL